MCEWCMMMWCRRDADAGRDPAGWRKDGGGPGGHPGGSLVEGSGGPPVLSGVAKPKEARKAEMIHLGEGLMPLPRRTVERIHGGEFVEFADFPVVDGGARAMDQAEQDLGDRVLVVQALDRRRTRREVPDASMWGSCFTLFERAALLADPARGPELSAYRETIQRAARTHQWDFVRRYDRQFRQSAAGDASRSWAKLDSTLFMQELAGPQAAYLASGFRGPAGGPDGAPSRKRGREAGSGGDPGGPDGKKGPGVCYRFNEQDGVCQFGARCKFRHACAKCGGDHPGSRCNSSQMEWRRGPGAGMGFGTG